LKKQHPVIEAPFSYNLASFLWSISPVDQSQSFIELHLEKNGLVKKIRFDQPTEVEIEKGFSGCISGLEILDISSWQLCNIGVEVSNFEPLEGISFKSKNAYIVE
jgi:hypothetical protein